MLTERSNFIPLPVFERKHSLRVGWRGTEIRVGLNIPQIELWAIWVGGMHCVIVTKLWGAQIFWLVGLNIPMISYPRTIPSAAFFAHLPD